MAVIERSLNVILTSVGSWLASRPCCPRAATGSAEAAKAPPMILRRVIGIVMVSTLVTLVEPSAGRVFR
jgi:hypothetical protein